MTRSEAETKVATWARLGKLNPDHKTCPLSANQKSYRETIGECGRNVPQYSDPAR